MAEITMCGADKCPYKSSCYRKLAKEDTWQSYANFKPECFNNDFSKFIPINGGKR